MRNELVKIQPVVPVPQPIQVVLGVKGCPQIYIWRSEHSQRHDLIDVRVVHGDRIVESFMLTRLEQAALMAGLRQLGICESATLTDAVDPSVSDTGKPSTRV